MIAYCQTLYRSLSEELARHHLCPSSFQQKIENCFGSCYRCWWEVAGKVAVHPFADGAEEIYFFRNVKPLFVSLIEYYQLLYHSLIFQPDAATGSPAGFWQREGKRLPHFIAQHNYFYHYYTNNCTHRDAEFFTRLPGGDEPHSASDHLVSRLLALQRYNIFVQRKVEV